MDRETAERLLGIAAASQSEFWEELSELEAELGCEVDGTRDLSDLTIDDLLEAGEDDSEEDCTCDERSWAGAEHDTACPLTGTRIKEGNS